MTNKGKKKKILIAKILTTFTFVLFVVLLGIIIWQTVEINSLNNQIEKLNETYQSQAEATKWAQQ